MNTPSPWLQWFLAILATIVASLVIILFKRALKRWDNNAAEIETGRREDANRREKKLEMLHIKIDCMDTGLRRMNGDTSTKYGVEVDKEMKRRVDEAKLEGRI